MKVERAVCGNDYPFDVARGLSRGARDRTARRLYLIHRVSREIAQSFPTEV
jgi:hypothetical protein